VRAVVPTGYIISNLFVYYCREVDAVREEGMKGSEGEQSKIQ